MDRQCPRRRVPSGHDSWSMQITIRTWWHACGEPQSPCGSARQISRTSVSRLRLELALGLRVDTFPSCRSSMILPSEASMCACSTRLRPPGHFGVRSSRSPRARSRFGDAPGFISNSSVSMAPSSIWVARTSPERAWAPRVLGAAISSSASSPTMMSFSTRPKPASKRSGKGESADPASSDVNVQRLSIFQQNTSSSRTRGPSLATGNQFRRAMAPCSL